MARFASVVLDADSTLSGIEGIDWLAERRSAAMQRGEASDHQAGWPELYAELDRLPELLRMLEVLIYLGSSAESVGGIGGVGSALRKEGAS